MAYHRKRTPRQQAPRHLVVYGSAALAVGLTAAIFATTQAADNDQHGCSIKRPPQEALLFFVDRTDPLTSHQTQAVHDLIDAKIADASPGERVAVFSLDSHWNGLAKPLFEICRPARRVTETRSGATQAYLDREWATFQAKVDGFVDNLTQAETAPTSPIFESLRAVTDTPEFRSASERRQLVVLTDGLENTADWPQARNAQASYTALGDDQFPKSVDANLRSANTSIYWLARPGSEGRLQTLRQRAFFTDWLTAKHATLTSPETLPL